MALLQVNNLGITFGGLRAVGDFEAEIEQNELVGLIGPNGAGKTTVFNLLTGVYQPTEGEILLGGRKINGLRTYEINKLGIARTFQNIRLFKDITVIENVLTALNSSMTYSPLSGIFKLPKYWRQEEDAARKAVALLEVFDLQEHGQDRAGSLPYGKQRKLEIARALATGPKLLLLDEPAAGMNPSETAELMETIQMIRKKFEIAVLLIEHDMNLVMGICERLIVLDYGMVIARGRPAEIQNDPSVIAAYLGE